MMIDDVLRQTKQRQADLATAIQADAQALAERERLYGNLGAEIAQRQNKLAADKESYIKLSGTLEALEFAASLPGPGPEAQTLAPELVE